MGRCLLWSADAWPRFALGWRSFSPLSCHSHAGPSPAWTLLQKCIECVQPSDPARTMIEVGCAAHPANSCNLGCGSELVGGGYAVFASLGFSRIQRATLPCHPPCADDCEQGPDAVDTHLWVPPRAGGRAGRQGGGRAYSLLCTCMGGHRIATLLLRHHCHHLRACHPHPPMPPSAPLCSVCWSSARLRS